MSKVTDYVFRFLCVSMCCLGGAAVTLFGVILWHSTGMVSWLSGIGLGVTIGLITWWVHLLIHDWRTYR